MKIKSEIFKAYDIRGVYPKELDEKTAYLIGRAFVEFLKKPKAKIAVGRDNRLSSPVLHKHLTRGINENNQLDFHSPYGCSKGSAEQYVRDYSRIYTLQTVVFRQSCIYGRHQFGIEDQGWIAWFTIAALLNKPIKLYGNGKQVRDVLFVDDLVDLYYLAITKINKVSGQIYNIGGGQANSISILELFDLLKNNHNLKIHYAKHDIRPGDQKIFISDNSKIGRVSCLA